MRRAAFLTLLLPLLLAPSCPVRRFELVMERTPDGKVQRELTIWIDENGDVKEAAEDMLAQARGAYGGPAEKVDEKHRFSSTFGATLPADLVHEGLTNHGLFACNASQIGKVFTYAERLPGQDDLVGLFRSGEQLTDTVVRAWVAWAWQQPELRRDAEKREKLVAFLQTEFRDDLLNGLLMAWQAFTRLSVIEDGGFDTNDSIQETVGTAEGLRLANYLVERGYLHGDEVPLLSADCGSALSRGILRKVAGVMGYPSPEALPPALAALADPAELEAAFEAGLKTIGMSPEEFQELLDPVMPAVFGDATSGRVVWRCKTKPLGTNGAWQAAEGEVSWKAAGREGCEPPQLLFAIWAEADDDFQRSHLGRSVVIGESLYAYNGWRESLPGAQRAEWDAFVDSLRPGLALAKKLREFRFRPPATMPTSAPATQAADEPPRGAGLLLERLGDGEK